MTILPIVEGHGEVECIRILLERIGYELLAEPYVEVRRPIRRPRSKLVQSSGLQDAIGLARNKLPEARAKKRGATVLVLLDGDGDPPCELGPRLQVIAESSRPDADVVCVIAHLEYETWFVAAAESLVGHGLVLADSEEVPADPESGSMRKNWIIQHMSGPHPGYRETLHQATFTAKMDLHLCRRRSPSFDKLCRELEKRRATAPSESA